jgi:hypothetical protein
MTRVSALTAAAVMVAVTHTAGRAPQAPPAGVAFVDLHTATVVTAPSATPRERNAVRVLVEEIFTRSVVRLPVSGSMPADDVPLILVGQLASARSWAGPLARLLGDEKGPGPEGYRIIVDRQARRAPTVLVIGQDERGVLFGVGRLLRELRMTRGELRLSADLRLDTAPKVALRGHQLGYRPKTNAYDAWDVPMWEQYIRDLTIFGTNAIELIPPRSDDADDSPHFTLPKMDMMVEMSRIADEYGLDVWIWYPALDKDYGDPKQVEFALQEWGDVFRKLPRIDALFVPGGDPGHTQPKHMFGLLEKQTANLRQHHPGAEMWMSPQGFTSDWMEEFYGLVQAEPAWLGGIVFGPQVRDPLPTLRKRLPQTYRIRRYPDITHSLRSQYPVPNWDLAHALTSERESVNPRPLDQAIIFRELMPYASNFITYSEGPNDDVNKFVWSGLGWDPETDVLQILREFSRYFIGDRYTDTFAQGLLALERNWKGPLATNASVYTTLQQFQSMEREAAPRDLQNWRFQQALYRAYYDAYQRARLLFESELEEQAMARLREARQLGAQVAIDQAAAVLLRADRERPAPEWRQRMYTLAEALFQSIRAQLSVTKYQAIAVGRGASLDSAERPLNNRRWLEARFAEIGALQSEEARLAAIDRIVDWTNPGPGGFYDDLGDPANQRHLVRGVGFEKDPGSFQSVSVGFGYRPEWRLSWMTHAESFYDAPLTMRYTGLDPNARYRVRVVYAGDIYSLNTTIRLVANDSFEVHPHIQKDRDIRPQEFDVPVAATRGGDLTLTWTQNPGRGGAGRGNQIAEVWLVRVETDAALTETMGGIVPGAPLHFLGRRLRRPQAVIARTTPETSESASAVTAMRLLTVRSAR